MWPMPSPSSSSTSRLSSTRSARRARSCVKSQLFRTPYGNYFCRFLSFALPCFLLKLAVVVGFSSTIALDLHQIQNDGVMNDAIYRRHRGHRVFEDLIPLAKNQIRRNDHRFVFIALGEER